MQRCFFLCALLVLALFVGLQRPSFLDWLPAVGGQEPIPSAEPPRQVDLRKQTKSEADYKSAGCIQCHRNTGDPHEKTTVNLGCVDCHGGNPRSSAREHAHVHPRFPDAWRSTGNPVRSYTLLNHETPDFVRFVNPGDLRIAHLSCGNCHQDEVLQNRMSMMTHGCMLWGAALYNNGSFPQKQAQSNGQPVPRAFFCNAVMWSMPTLPSFSRRSS